MGKLSVTAVGGTKTFLLSPSKFGELEDALIAKHGDNIASLSANMPWYQGPTVLQTLDEFQMTDLPTHKALRFPIQDTTL